MHWIHFLPEATFGLRVLSLSASVCVYVSLSMCQSRACPRYNSSPVSAKIPIVCGGDWLWPSRSNLTSQSKFTPFWACPCDNSSPIQAWTTKFGPEVQNTLVKIPVVLGIDWAWHVKFNIFSKSCLFASLLILLNICEACINIWKRSLFHILNGCTHSVVSWTVEQASCIFSLTIVGFPVLKLAIAMDFQCYCRLSLNYTYLTCQNFVCQHSVMVETTLKPRAFAFIMSDFQHVLGNPALFLAPT